MFKIKKKSETRAAETQSRDLTACRVAIAIPHMNDVLFDFALGLRKMFFPCRTFIVHTRGLPFGLAPKRG